MNGARPWIAYVGPVAFPGGGAAARRILGNTKALVAAGYDVVIVSGQPPGRQGESFNVAPGIRCVSVDERDAEHLPKVLRYARYALMGARSRRWLDTQPMLPSAVVLYSGYTPYLLQFTSWARRRGVALLFDAVEWYTAPNLAHFLLSPYLWNIELAMRVLIPRVDGVIAISRTLEHFYAAVGMPVARLPPLFDPRDTVQSVFMPDPKKPLRLVYAGSPGRKDLVDPVISAVIDRDDGSGRLVLEIAGLSEAELCRREPISTRDGALPPCIRAHGRLSHAESLALVARADFTVFLRAVNRVSTCGFPTKFVESLAQGTPVISNLTGDLANHLRDGETGLVCPAPTQTALEATLDRALALDTQTRTALRDAARAEAESAFGYGNYVGMLEELLVKTVGNANDRTESDWR